jgi:hypothetical protein
MNRSLGTGQPVGRYRWCSAKEAYRLTPLPVRFEEHMRLMAVAVAAALVMSAASVAEAQQPRPRRVVAEPPGTYVVHRDESGRTRTKILVQKRSYLDGGTEVMPGDIQSHQTNFIDMHQSPMSAVSNNNIVPGRPINDPFFLPGKNNPYFR